MAKSDPRQKRRIGIFGGSFDPLHVGHLAAALWAADACALERVLMVVANDPWQKTATRAISPSAIRLEALVKSIEDIPVLEPSDIEMERGGPSFTIETVEQLSERHLDARFTIIVGTDAASGLESWHRWEDLAAAVDVAVVERPVDIDVVLAGPWRVSRCQMPQLDLSSTELRQRLSENRSVDFLVPEAALRVYRSYGLYA